MFRAVRYRNVGRSIGGPEVPVKTRSSADAVQIASPTARTGITVPTNNRNSVGLVLYYRKAYQSDLFSFSTFVGVPIAVDILKFCS